VTWGCSRFRATLVPLAVAAYISSAGHEPGQLDPLAVAATDEVGIDMSHSRTKRASDLFKAGRIFDYVVTVCDEASAQRCPIFPGVMKRLHWSFADPASFEGFWEQRLALTRIVRDQICGYDNSRETGGSRER
jgi:arsenate reductase